LSIETSDARVGLTVHARAEHAGGSSEFVEQTGSIWPLTQLHLHAADAAVGRLATIMAASNMAAVFMVFPLFCLAGGGLLQATRVPIVNPLQSVIDITF
jgi:hypothetical protein